MRSSITQHQPRNSYALPLMHGAWGVTVWEAATARRLFSSRAALEAFRAQWNFGNGCLGLLSGHGAPGELCRLMQMLLHENPLRRVIPREL